MKLPEPGHLRGESREDGMKRRKVEGDRKTHKLWLEIKKAEQEKLESARRLVEERLGSYEDRPMDTGIQSLHGR